MKKFIMAAVASSLMTASTASATTLSWVDAGQMHEVARNDVLPGRNQTSIQHVSGFLNFAFGKYRSDWARPLFNNDGAANRGVEQYAMGFAKKNARTSYTLFDNTARRGGRGFGDKVMRIDVAAVPLPAGGLLLLSALGGALVLRRRTKLA